MYMKKKTRAWKHGTIRRHRSASRFTIQAIRHPVNQISEYFPLCRRVNDYYHCHFIWVLQSIQKQARLLNKNQCLGHRNVRARRQVAYLHFMLTVINPIPITHCVLSSGDTNGIYGFLILPTEKIKSSRTNFFCFKREILFSTRAYGKVYAAQWKKKIHEIIKISNGWNAIFFHFIPYL